MSKLSPSLHFVLLIFIDENFSEIWIFWQSGVTNKCLFPIVMWFFLCASTKGFIDVSICSRYCLESQLHYGIQFFAVLIYIWCLIRLKFHFYFIISGEPEVVLTTDSGVQIPVNKHNNNDRTYRVEFTATVVGSVTASVLFDHHPVPNSPFKINVQPGGVDVSKVRVPDLPKGFERNFTDFLLYLLFISWLFWNYEMENKLIFQCYNFNIYLCLFFTFIINFLFTVITVGKETPFNIVTAEAGKGQAKVNLVSPSGKVIPSPVEEKPDGFVGKVTAEEPGLHVVQVTFAEQPVPNSPFHVDAVLPDAAPAGGVDASKVKAYGSGLNKGTVNAPCDFTIDTSAAGPGSLGLTIDGPTEAKIECFDKGGGLFDVRYWPTEPGEYTTNILFDDKPVPNSPFKAQVNPTTLVDVSGVKTYGPGLQPSGKLFSFK